LVITFKKEKKKEVKTSVEKKIFRFITRKMIILLISAVKLGASKKGKR
jgi:hypothetical protein